MAASKFKSGQKVRQVLPKPEEGNIIDIGIDKVEGERLFLVAWNDGDGNEHSGWYREDELEEVAVEPPAPPAE
jgi:hypothetical protein